MFLNYNWSCYMQKARCIMECKEEVKHDKTPSFGLGPGIQGDHSP